MSLTSTVAITTVMPKQLSYITPATLRTWIDLDPQDVAVVDVRDIDYVGGHIVNAINIPAAEFELRISQLESQIASKAKVVFHCMLSQQRGPTCAAAYTRSLANKGHHSQEVYVLTGGFSQWAQKYGSNPEYTEGFVPELYQ